MAQGGGLRAEGSELRAEGSWLIINTDYMKRVLLLVALVMGMGVVAHAQRQMDPSFRYFAQPGLVNIIEFNYGLGMDIFERDSLSANSYFGITNVAGYQANRNFFFGLGFGYLRYDSGNLFPLYMEFKYSLYLKGITPYFYADAGGLLSFSRFDEETKIFANPGIGASFCISPHVELSLSAGYNVQARTTITSVEFLTFKAGVSYRLQPYRMLKAKNNRYY